LLLDSNEVSPNPGPDVTEGETTADKLENTAEDDHGISTIQNTTDNGTRTYE